MQIKFPIFEYFILHLNFEKNKLRNWVKYAFKYPYLAKYANEVTDFFYI